jgi:hypothetical protein
MSDYESKTDIFVLRTCEVCQIWSQSHLGVAQPVAIVPLPRRRECPLTLAYDLLAWPFLTTNRMMSSASPLRTLTVYQSL